MEEWRAVLSDATAMSLINGHEIHKEDYYQPDGDEGIYLTTHGFKSFIRKFEGKLQTSSRYLSYVEYSVNFRRAMDLQVNAYCNVLETGDPNLYKPVIIR